MVNRGLAALVLAAMGVIGCGEDQGRPITFDVESGIEPVTESVSSGRGGIEGSDKDTPQNKRNAAYVEALQKKLPEAYRLSQMSFEDAAKELNAKHSYGVTPEFLVEQSRLWFLEAGRDRAMFNGKDVHKKNLTEDWWEGAYEYDKLVYGLQAVVHGGLLNRWKVDNELAPYEGLNCRDVAIFSRDGDLMGVINDEWMTKKGLHRNRSEYSAFKDNPWAFKKKSLKGALASGEIFDDDELAKLHEGDGIDDTEVRVNLTYLTYLACLTGELGDNTSESVAYRAIEWTDEHLKSQYGKDEAYCDAWNVEAMRTHPTDQFECAVGCSYDLNPAIIEIGSHQFRGIDVTQKSHMWHNGKKTTKRKKLN
jgi:hypothetical protein